MKTTTTLLVGIALVATLAAQSGARITGFVMDASGAPLPGAKVTATVNGRTQSTTADARGRYLLSDVPLGDCRVTATLPGFRNVEKLLVLATPSQHDTDFRLRVGCSGEYATVIFNLREILEFSPTVLVVQATSVPSKPCVDEKVCYECSEHALFVEQVIKGRRALATTTIRAQLPKTVSILPGARFVAFAELDRDSQRYEVRWDPALQIGNGTVSLTKEHVFRTGVTPGVLTLGDFIDLLKSWSPEKSR